MLTLPHISKILNRFLSKLPANCNVRTVVRVTLESKVKKV
ncbi:hypothetical protein WCLE_002340 [Wolbachia endosymbiont of Cimex lectularius]|nr:hypothetical protein WCLE_002340 [Wolbachia endosymbiont of Cimex lectularius]